jgi:hypothetical protein
MRVESYKENEDGSGTVVFELTKDEIKHLIQYAVVNMLDKFVKEKGHECSGSCSSGGECKGDCKGDHGGDHTGECKGDCKGDCDGSCGNNCDNGC